jgi:DNA-binding NarL/FixJ family response regulator
MTTHQRILLVDSDPRFRRMVKALIRRHYPRIIVSEACNPQDALRQVRCFTPGMIMTEIDLSGRRILDLPRKMRALHPECRIVVLSNYDLPEYRAAAFEAGAHDFISKSVPAGQTIMGLVEKTLNPAPSIRRQTKKGVGDAHRERKRGSGRGPDESTPERDRSSEHPDQGLRRLRAASKWSSS